MKRLETTLDDTLSDDLDAFASYLGITRAAAGRLCVRKWISKVGTSPSLSVSVTEDTAPERYVPKRERELTARQGNSPMPTHPEVRKIQWADEKSGANPDCLAGGCMQARATAGNERCVSVCLHMVCQPR
jgi:hypothetical protein